MIQFLHEVVESIVYRILQDIPVLLTLFIPFAELNLVTHEVQFFPDVRTYTYRTHAPVEIFSRTHHTFFVRSLLFCEQLRHVKEEEGNRRYNNTSERKCL